MRIFTRQFGPLLSATLRRKLKAARRHTHSVRRRSDHYRLGLWARRS